MVETSEKIKSREIRNKSHLAKNQLSFFDFILKFLKILVEFFLWKFWTSCLNFFSRFWKPWSKLIFFLFENFENPGQNLNLRNNRKGCPGVGIFGFDFLAPIFLASKYIYWITFMFSKWQSRKFFLVSFCRINR